MSVWDYTRQIMQGYQNYKECRPRGAEGEVEENPASTFNHKQLLSKRKFDSLLHIQRI